LLALPTRRLIPPRARRVGCSPTRPPTAKGKRSTVVVAQSPESWPASSGPSAVRWRRPARRSAAMIVHRREARPGDVGDKLWTYRHPPRLSTRKRLLIARSQAARAERGSCPGIAQVSRAGIIKRANSVVRWHRTKLRHMARWRPYPQHSFRCQSLSGRETMIDK